MAEIDHKTRLDSNKRIVPPIIKKILEYDVLLTKNFVAFTLNFIPIQSLKTYCQFLEYSCHGIAWLVGWLAFCWIIDNSDLYQMQVNMILGLLLDIIFVALIKAATRRRRPVKVTGDIFCIGPDEFSFPSGHASRSFYILSFFTFLYPVHWILWPTIFTWASSIAISRLLLYRHHILDIICGILLGIFEAILLNLLWLGPSICNWIMMTISEDHVPGGPESA